MNKIGWMLAAAAAACCTAGCDTPPEAAAGPCPADNVPLFTATPFDSSLITDVSPLASFAPYEHTFPTQHAYINIDETRVRSAPGGRATVRAPGRIQIYRVEARRHAGPVSHFSADIYFAVCDEVTGYFINLVDVHETQPVLVAAFRQAIQNAGASELIAGDWLDQPLILNPGEPLGYAGVSPQDARVFYRGVDLGVRDYRNPTNFGCNFARPERFRCTPEFIPRRVQERFSAARAFAANPLHFFEAGLRLELTLKVGISENGRDFFPNRIRTNPDTGASGPLDRFLGPGPGNSIYQDLPGTARGYWFDHAELREPNPTGENFYVFLGLDSLVPEWQTFVTGLTADLLPTINDINAILSWKPRGDGSGAINPRLAETTPGAWYCIGDLYSPGARGFYLNAPRPDRGLMYRFRILQQPGNNYVRLEITRRIIPFDGRTENACDVFERRCRRPADPAIPYIEPDFCRMHARDGRPPASPIKTFFR